MLTETDVRAAEAQRCAAMIAGDGAALDCLFAGDLVWIHSSGLVEDKVTFLDRLCSGAGRYVAIALSDEAVRIYDDVAVVTFISKTTVEARGESRVIDNLNTDVWIKKGSAMRLVSCQSTKAS
jgi:hypothetical protein